MYMSFAAAVYGIGMGVGGGGAVALKWICPHPGGGSSVHIYFVPLNNSPS
jgi:hypothetical protein